MEHEAAKETGKDITDEPFLTPVAYARLAGRARPRRSAGRRFTRA